MYVQLREHLSSLEVGNEGLGMNQGLNAFTGSIVRQFLLTKLNYSANVNMSGFILKLSKKEFKLGGRTPSVENPKMDSKLV